ncbi:MAG: glycosyltransferase, partial [Oricola sp.]
VEAMTRVDNDCVLIVMGPDGGCSERLKEIAARSGLTGTKVHFHEAVPQAQLLEWVASADVGIVPYPAVDLNARLCTPNKLFDFITCGVPVLANDLPELRRIIGDSGIGIVADMSDVASLARAITQILSSDLAEMRKQSLKLSPKMCWQEQEPVLLALYSVMPNR